MPNNIWMIKVYDKKKKNYTNWKPVDKNWYKSISEDAQGLAAYINHICDPKSLEYIIHSKLTKDEYLENIKMCCTHYLYKEYLDKYNSKNAVQTDNSNT